MNVYMLLRYLRYDPRTFLPPEIEVCSYIANFGHSVTLIVPSNNERAVEQFYLNKVNIYTIPNTRYISGTSLFARSFNMMLNRFRRLPFILRTFKQGEYDLVFVGNETWDQILAIYIKMRYRVPIVFILENPLEQQWEIHKLLSSKHRCMYYFIFKFSSFLALQTMRIADLVLPVGRRMVAYLAKRGIEGPKVKLIPQCVDVKLFSNMDGKDIRKKYNLSNLKVIIYIGNMQKVRNLGLLIHAFSLVTKQKKDVKLLMVGDGTDRANLERLANELGIEDSVIFTGQVPHYKVPSFIAAAYLGVSAVPPLSFYKVSSPIKQIEYMAMAKPVVANEEIPEHKEVIEQSGGGILVPCTADAFADAIVELLNNPAKATEMGERGLEWVIKNRSYEFWARRIEEEYFELLKLKKASRNDTD